MNLTGKIGPSYFGFFVASLIIPSLASATIDSRVDPVPVSAECVQLSKLPNTDSAICRIAERGMTSEVELRIKAKPELLSTNCSHLGDLARAYSSQNDLFTHVLAVRDAYDWFDIQQNKKRSMKNRCSPGASAIADLDSTVLMLANYIEPREVLTVLKNGRHISDAELACGSWQMAATYGESAGFKNDSAVLSNVVATLKARGANFNNSACQ